MLPKRRLLAVSCADAAASPRESVALTRSVVPTNSCVSRWAAVGGLCGAGRAAVAAAVAIVALCLARELRAQTARVASDLKKVIDAAATPNLTWARDVNGQRYVTALIVADGMDPEMTALRAAVVAPGGTVYLRFVSVTALSTLLPARSVEATAWSRLVFAGGSHVLSGEELFSAWQGIDDPRLTWAGGVVLRRTANLGAPGTPAAGYPRSFSEAIVRNQALIARGARALSPLAGPSSWLAWSGAFSPTSRRSSPGREWPGDE